jgi:type II secretory pathway pseudopilin PulG
MTRALLRSTLRHSFTIIELLVVIAIIAVLISLLLPALRSARNSARQLACASDLRQFLTVINVYTNDNRAYIPLPNWGPVATAPGWLYDQTVGPAVAQPFTEDDRRTGSLFPYLEAPKIYRCPSHEGPFAGTALMTSYIMNGAVVAYKDPTRSYRIDQFAADAIIMWDANEQGPVAFNDGASYPNEIVAGHHGTGINGACVDGSATYLNGEQFATQLTKKPGRLWCNPISRTGQ